MGAWRPRLAAYVAPQKDPSTAGRVHLVPERRAATALRRAPGSIPAAPARKPASRRRRGRGGGVRGGGARQRGAAENTITSCRQAWNMLLGYVAGHHHVGVEKVTFTMVDRATVTGFLDHMQATKSWTASTRNQRLAC